MGNKVYDVWLDIDWQLINTISFIDRFDSQWASVERRGGQRLKQLKSIATIRSVGASTRIEGAKMSDAEIDVFLKNMDVSKLEDRDSQEVAGYFNTLDFISEQHEHIGISESSIKSLHNILMKHSAKDEWHKGNYKVHNNAVEATFLDGTRQTIFRTAEVGFATEEAMRRLVGWYSNEQEVHPLVKSAVFTYEFLSVHPFQDGNGRLSRLLSTLLLLKNGYRWIQYVSFEHEIESRKNEYYRVLRSCQAQRPNENVSEWVMFFLTALKNVQAQLMAKLDQQGAEAQLSSREKSIVAVIQDYPGIQSGGIAKRLGIPSPTVKRTLADLQTKGLIEKHGNGRTTSYSVK